MEKGLVSFIIATYRHFEGVYPTLDSLFMQDYPRVEIIFSDDGSPEYEKEIPAVKAYVDAHKGPNIVRVLYNRLPENQGTIRNCNSAYRLASGEYLKDLAPEDTLSRPDALRRYVDFLEKEKVLCCFSRQEGVDASGKLVPHLASSAEDYETLASLSPDQLRKRLFVRNCLPAPAFFAKTELFRTYGYYPEEVRLIEDYPYWLRLCEQQVRIGFLNETLVHYRLTASGMGSYSPAFMDDMDVIYNQFIFPYDRRYGALQPAYNALKRAGLQAYRDRACWADYSPSKKAAALIRRWPFFAYIRWGEMRMKRKNAHA